MGSFARSLQLQTPCATPCEELHAQLLGESSRASVTSQHTQQQQSEQITERQEQRRRQQQQQGQGVTAAAVLEAVAHQLQQQTAESQPQRAQPPADR